MVLDSSAVLSMLLGDDRAPALITALVEAERPRMSVANWLEVAMLIEERGGRLASLRLDEFFRVAGIELMPVDAAQAEAARTAWRHFGRHKHSARLEPGECYAYALAKHHAAPLLFVSDGLARTDIEPALKET
jgi:ribonuclease VapC